MTKPKGDAGGGNETAGITRRAAVRESPRRYRRLWWYSVLLTALVSLLPLFVMTAVNYRLSSGALKAEVTHRISRLTATTRRSIEDFIEAHLAAVTVIIRNQPHEDLCSQEKLALVLDNLKNAFGGFVDLGLLDANGLQTCYSGPYDLKGKSYRDQDWFREVGVKGVYVSDVFLGYRNFPHFVIAVKNDRRGQGDFSILRATVNTDALDQYLSALNRGPAGDAFLINRERIIQTRGRHFGGLLERCPFPLPAASFDTQVVESRDDSGRVFILGYAYLRRSPFILMVLERPEDPAGGWLTLRNDILWLFLCAVILLLVVITGGCTYYVRRIRDADLRWAEAFNHVQYTNKLASIGRLAAGVAHEINNPMAIINENAGLLKDLVSARPGTPEGARFLRIAETILSSVGRCSAITHRLLGFAKQMTPQTAPIDLEALIREVLGFLGKEAEHRNLAIRVEVAEGLPRIESDRGQLQQVFLNILTNAFAAVPDGGRIGISLLEGGGETVVATISDNGCGIPEEDLDRIFEPFFTTKKEYGTGLGLSITYGIVQKLGGQIGVKSKAGEGTSFSVTLPVRPR